MSNKRIQLSTAAMGPWLTLPGNTGEFASEANTTTDTIYGQPYESMETNLKQWNVTANGLFKNNAGYNLQLMKSGVSTPMANEPIAAVTGQANTYAIVNQAHAVIDYNSPSLALMDGSTNVTQHLVSVDYLAGSIVTDGYAFTGAPTISANYLPMAVIANARAFSLTQTATAIDQSTYSDAQANGGWRSFKSGLNTVSISITNIYNITGAWAAALAAGGIIYVKGDLNATNAGATVFRGFFMLSGRTQSGNQGDLETEALTMPLYVPDGALVQWPFQWYFTAASKLNPAVQACLQAFTAQTPLYVRYLPNGIAQGDGQTGQAILIEATLANAIDGINTFTFNFRGTEQPTAV